MKYGIQERRIYMRKEIVTYYCDYCKKPVAENQLIWDSCNVNNILEFCPECLDTHKQYVIDEYFKNDFNYLNEYFEDVIKVKGEKDKFFVIRELDDEGEIINLNQMYEIAWEGYKKMFIHKSK